MEGDASQIAALLSSKALRIHNVVHNNVIHNVPPESNEEAEALHFAAARGHAAVVEVLIAAGAGVNQIFPGGSALHAAVMGNYPKVVALLLAAGAKPDLSDRALDSSQQGWTALMYAACYGRTEIAHQLLQAGAQPDLADRDGQTPLMIAAHAGHTAVALLLLEAGAQLTIQDHYGNTALACALGPDCESLAQLIAQRAENELKATTQPPTMTYRCPQLASPY